MKHYEKRRSVSSKLFVMMLALVLVFGCAVGGTIAWLTAKTDPVVNTFTYGDINIELTESTGSDYKIIPGVEIEKDPRVKVKAGSEACWLFVKVEEAGTFVANKVTYSVDDSWTKGNGTDIPANVYYRKLGAATNDISFDVLAGNKINVSSDLTKEDIKGITTKPTLTFTAYAVQKDGIDTAADAWAKIPSANP